MENVNGYILKNIEKYKDKLENCDVQKFKSPETCFRDFLSRIKINKFRHIHDLDITFDSPITVISGGNKIGKTSILLLIACSFENFRHMDSTTPETLFRRFTWKDVIQFTKDETDNGGYSYELFWRLGNEKEKHGEGKRGIGKKSWTGLGKLSHTRRINAKIKDREVRFIDLDRIHPARGCSKRLNYKASHSKKILLDEEIVDYYKYIFRDNRDIKIYQTGSHINKRIFLIEFPDNRVEAYSSYNDASGEESILNLLIDICEAGNNSLLLIDELECGIHPETQRRLADIIQYLSWTKKQQFVITTHSPTLLSAFPKKSRKLIEKDFKGGYIVSSSPSIELVFSKLDSIAHPLIRLYCEDDVASFCIRKILIERNNETPYFDRVFNIIISGPSNEVINDYKRHERNFNQMVPKQGYCCVLDGDRKAEYKKYLNNSEKQDFIFFLYSEEAPEKFLVKAYLQFNQNPDLDFFINEQDHHRSFDEMVRLGLAVDSKDALSKCWDNFIKTEGYSKMKNEMISFFNMTLSFFSNIN